MPKQTPQTDPQLPTEVYRAELADISERRSAAGVKPLPEGTLKAHGPSLKHGLVGLAISGGGIRSSTFSLGVLQSLLRARVFKHFDYVSTVSGGGYTGSMLSSLLGTPRPAEEPFPLTKEPGQPEPPALQHLRNGSNYLSPGGLLAQLRLPLQVLRGLLFNVVLLLPWLVLAACVTGLLYHLNHFSRAGEAVPLTSYAAVPLVGMVLLSPTVMRWFRALLGWKARNVLSLTMAALLGLALLGLVFVPLGAIVDRAISTSWRFSGGVSPWTLLKQVLLGDLTWATVASQWGTGLLGGAAVLAALVAFALLRPSSRVGKGLGQAALVAIGLLGPGVLFAVYLLLCVALVPTQVLPAHFQRLLPAADAAPLMLTPPEVLEGKSSREYTAVDELTSALSWRSLRLEELSAPCVFPLTSGGGAERSWGVSSCSPQGTPDRAHVLTKIVRTPGRLEVMPDKKSDLYLMPAIFLVLGLLLSVGTILLLTVLSIDVNTTSLHPFYRDRLSRMYLFRTREGEVVPTDTLRLSELNAQGSAAPYHLLNVTLNLHGSSDPSLRGRKSGFFIFSKRYCGGPQTGYCQTRELEKVDPRVNLGTAMAISAAAASPNMGTMPLGPVRFLMALLNLRLGYWAPNPRRLAGSSAGPRLRTRLRYLLGPGALHLLREAFGSVKGSGAYVNLSDGGHLENLGVYELLRRRCKVVVAIDGEADAPMAFPSLHALMRYAWIDLGVRIELKDLGQLRRKDGTSSQHYAIGSIDYGSEGQGTFVYIKSSMTGDEDPIQTHYRAENPAFPHESTADQFFSEHQFESYRGLGEHIGSELVAEEAFRALFPAEDSQRAAKERMAA